MSEIRKDHWIPIDLSKYEYIKFTEMFDMLTLNGFTHLVLYIPGPRGKRRIQMIRKGDNTYIKYQHAVYFTQAK